MMNNAENPQLTIPRVIKRGFKKGDRVEIVGNIPFALKDKPRPLLGTVTNVDGFYILVKPLYQRWEGEWYANELHHVL
jgi:hypothetical protein